MPQDSKHERPIVTVDIVLMTIDRGKLAVALLDREAEPFRGEPALIGGYIHTDEDADAEAAVRRILTAKAGLEGFYFEQLKTFARRSRDPRGWSLSVAYFALVPHSALIGQTGGKLRLMPADAPGLLPFDHCEIVACARQRLKGKGAYSSMVARLLPEVFTLPELQAAYETVLDEKLDQSAFRRKIGDLDILEELAGQKRQTASARRPTALYRLKDEPTVFNRRL